MNRRSFLSLLAGTTAAAAAGLAIPELWTPKRTFFLPPRDGWPSLRDVGDQYGGFQASRAYVSGDVICLPNGELFVCTQAGMTGELFARAYGGALPARVLSGSVLFDKMRPTWKRRYRSRARSPFTPDPLTLAAARCSAHSASGALIRPMANT